MHIIADENIPYVRDFFGQLGDVTTLPGRTLTRTELAKADMLLVRSVTRVNADLLSGTAVRFVATATIGTDHIDQHWLAQQGMGFSAAPGSNAESVAQFMAAALGTAAGRLGRTLAGATIGIVGAGNCGSRVARVAHALGMHVVLNDPPLARQTNDPQFKALNAALACDYLALHVPLTRDGEDATWNLIGHAELARINPGCVIINACRGHVLNEQAALEALVDRRIAGLVLDAWEGEPAISPASLNRVMLATPHIAGYSLDGKVAGTQMIYEAACRYFETPLRDVALNLPSPACERIELNCAQRDFQSVVTELVLTAYPIQRDDADLRRSLRAAHDDVSRGREFDLRRKYYPMRREFEATRVTLHNAPRGWEPPLRQLGFAQVKIISAPDVTSSLNTGLHPG